jgi:hypothetical protein
LGVDELAHALPSICAFTLIFAILHIEEAMGRIGIRNELVLHAGTDERTVKCLDIGGRDAVVSAAENAEDWRRQLVSAL